jgi:hypothetical protein
MNTLTDKILPVYEKVIHIAFGCGCVQSYRPKQMTSQRCPIHGDTMVSSNQEYQEKAAVA